MDIEVRGHSGCKIEILQESGMLYICKSSYSKDYFDRLMKQADKQLCAYGKKYSHIRIPRIYDVSRNDDEVSIKMEYVYSKHFIEYFENAGFKQIDDFISSVTRFIDDEIGESAITSVDGSVLENKFSNIKDKIQRNPLVCNDAQVKYILERASAKLCDVKTLSIPIGVCHGDLTFSNILFSGDNCYLIDFLDSFMESPLMDIVKIRQDSRFLWSQLMYTKNYDHIRLHIICKKIDDAINRYFEQYEWYREYYGILQMINMLRVLQYANEEKVVKFLKKTLNEILDEF